MNAVKPYRVADTDGMRFWLGDAGKSLWQSTEMMGKATIFLAGQDRKWGMGTVPTDQEICTWHGFT